MIRNKSDDTPMRDPEEFFRIQKLPPYVFEEVNKLKAKLRHDGVDIIDFGFGNPDMPTPKHIIDKLIETVQKPRTTGYSVSRGIMGLRQACARYYDRRFDVQLDPTSEIVATIGSKEGFANLAQAITRPGDVIYAPDPSYPLHAFGFIIAGAEIQGIPAITADEYLAGVKQALKVADKLPMAIVVCFPSNPTGQVADLSFYEEIVAIAKQHDIIVLSDLAYSEIYFTDEKPPSIFQVDGAKDVAVETISLSKTYSMAGWRMGFAVGSKRLITALARVKSYLDYGAFTPIQGAACAALDGPASMFAWAKLPPEFSHLGSVEFAKKLMLEAEVAVSPGLGFGPNGDQYVRIAFVENEQRIRQAARNIKSFFDQSRQNVA